MMKIWLLAMASMGFGAALTVALTKPPVVAGLFGVAAKFLGSVFAHAL